MFNAIHSDNPFSLTIQRTPIQYFCLLLQITCLSAVFILLFQALWSVSLFLPLSVGVEMVVKLLATQIIQKTLCAA